MASFSYDAFDNLASAAYTGRSGTETIYRAPDKIGNLFRTKERTDRVYGKGGQLLEDPKHYYHYDSEGNLIFKELKVAGSIPLSQSRAERENALGIKLKGSGGGWQYHWAGNGMLGKVTLPQGGEVKFSYDPLGRRIAKQYKGKVTRWLWDGNVPLHEWSYIGKFPPQMIVDAEGSMRQREEQVENLITWIYEEDSFVPCARIEREESYSIVTDYLGTPTHAFDQSGKKVWERELDIYGSVRKEEGLKGLVPQLYQGQWADEETGLAYNRFRYYDRESGNYNSQDPIGIAGGNKLYGYVINLNIWVDQSGLNGGNLLGKNLNKANQGVLSGNRSLDWNAHHVIPQKTWDKFTKTSGDGFFNKVGFKGKHSGANGIYLPNDAEFAKKHGFEYYHPGSHPNYNSQVEARITAIQDQYNVHGDKAKAKADLEKMQARLKEKMSPNGSGTPKTLNHHH